MAESAPVTRYRNEYIAGFEQNQSLLRECTTTEAMVDGNTATFLVADSGDAEATTRGLNGLITARGDNLTQSSATLVEWHDLVRKTRFNVFESQGNQRAIMQKTSQGVLNRKIDQDIITELNTGTVNTGTAVTADLGLVMKGITILQNSEVPADLNITAVITPAFHAYLMQVKEFSSREYIDKLTFPMNDPAWRDKIRPFVWLNVYWIVHPRLPGSVGAGGAGSAEKCFLFHKTAIGHAYDRLDVKGGYNDEQDYYWTRATNFMGSQLLQNSGVVIINHDGSALKAA